MAVIPIPALINGKSYDWQQIQVVILGVPIVGITALDYSDSSTMENIYGAGRFPVSRGYGKYEAMATITMLMEELENITSIAPNRRIQDIPEFNITVAYVDTENIVRNHTIRNCRFKGNNRKTASGDTSIPVELELVTSHIDW